MQRSFMQLILGFRKHTKKSINMQLKRKGIRVFIFPLPFSLRSLLDKYLLILQSIKGRI
jgi:hypothetical protein